MKTHEEVCKKARDEKKAEDSANSEQCTERGGRHGLPSSRQKKAIAFGAAGSVSSFTFFGNCVYVQKFSLLIIDMLCGRRT